MVAGCGNGGGDKAPSAERYAAAVTRICTANAREFQKLVKASTGDFLASEGDKFVEVSNRNIAKLKRLRPPPELESKAQRLIAYAEATRDQLSKLVDIAKRRPGTVGLGSGTLLETRRQTIDAASAVGANC